MSLSGSDSPAQGKRIGRFAHPAAAFGLVLVCVSLACALHWPLPLHLDEWKIVGAFHDSHVWCFDHVYQVLSGDLEASLSTTRIGYPETVQLRLILWLPALLSVPLRIWMGPLGAYHVVLLCSPALSALAAWYLLRRVADATPVTAAGAALIYAFCPYALGSMANGQTAKIQLWILPLVLLFLSKVASGSRQRAGAIGLVVATLGGAFTSPSTALFLPFAALCLVVWEIARAQGQRRVVARRCLLGLVLVAAALIPARGYYGGVQSSPLDQGAHQFGDELLLSAFAPGDPAPGEELLDPSLVAQPDETFLGSADRGGDPTRVQHVTYVGFPLFLVTLLLCTRRFAGRGLALGLTLVGVILAFGPRLAIGGSYLQAGGIEFLLPAALLERFHYPTAASGMYYRAIHMCALGMAIAVAGAMGRVKAPWGPILACGIGLGQVADGWRATRPMWPRHVEPVAALGDWQAWREAPGTGAVVEFPLEVDSHAGGTYMMAAAFHGRATNGLPRQVSAGLPHIQSLHELFDEALAEEEEVLIRKHLVEAGVGVVVCHTRCIRDGTFQALEQALGPPEGAPGRPYWILESP